MGGLQLRRVLGDHHLNGLMLGDGLTEGLPLLGIPDGLLEGAAGDADASRRHVDAADLEAAHDLIESLALPASQQVRCGDAVVVEDQLAGVYSFVAQLGYVPGHIEARPLFGDKDAHAPAGRVGGGVCLDHQGKGISVAPVGDKGLGPIHHVFVAVPRRPCLDRLDVASRVGLGNANAAALLSRGHQGQEPLLLLLCPVGGNHMGHDEVGVQDAAQAHPAAADFFDDQRVGRYIQPYPAVLLGYQRAEEAKSLHFLHEVNGILVRVLHA